MVSLYSRRRWCRRFVMLNTALHVVRYCIRHSCTRICVMHLYYNTLHRTIPLLQHTTTHYNTLHRTIPLLQYATHTTAPWNTLRTCCTHTATLCNTRAHEGWAQVHDQMNESYLTYEWVIFKVSLSVVHMHEDVVHMHEDKRTPALQNEWVLSQWVMSHIWMSHVTHMNESCHIYEWVLSHIWISHVTHVKESCHTYEWVMSHIWLNHVTRMNEGRCTHALPKTPRLPSRPGLLHCL